MRFSHNLTHGIWGKVNDCTVLYSTVQYSAVLYSTVRVYMPALALLRVKLPDIFLILKITCFFIFGLPIFPMTPLCMTIVIIFMLTALLFYVPTFMAWY